MVNANIGNEGVTKVLNANQQDSITVPQGETWFLEMSFNTSGNAGTEIALNGEVILGNNKTWQISRGEDYKIVLGENDTLEIGLTTGFEDGVIILSGFKVS